MFLMDPPTLLRTPSALSRFGIVAVDLAQCLQHVTAFVRNVLGYFYKLPATVHQARGRFPISQENRPSLATYTGGRRRCQSVCF